MNTDRIDQVIASIKGEIEHTKTLGFNMDVFCYTTNDMEDDMTGRGCGTVACIAGHAFHLSNTRRKAANTAKKRLPGYEFTDAAADWLELDETRASALFYAKGAGKDMSYIKPEEAIAVLENLKATGEVDWSQVE